MVVDKNVNPNNEVKNVSAEKIKPILAANIFGPALIKCGFTPDILNPLFIKKQIGLYFNPKNTLITKSPRTININIGFDVKIKPNKNVNTIIAFTRIICLSTLLYTIGHDLFTGIYFKFFTKLN